MGHAVYGSHVEHGVLSLKGVASMISHLPSTLIARARLRATERHLRSLDDRQLADIGICRADIHDVVWGRRTVR